jgi:hypothetical protein
MSPTILAVPAIHPKTSVAGASGGTSFATARPFFVMTTGVRYFFTSSITRRHRALNSPAGIVFMTPSPVSWSRARDHDNSKTLNNALPLRLLLTTAAYILSKACAWRRGTAWATARVATLRERLLKLGVWLERSVRRVVVHFHAAFAWRWE